MTADGVSAFTTGHTTNSARLASAPWSGLAWIDARGGGSPTPTDSPLKVWDGSAWVAASAPPTA